MLDDKDPILLSVSALMCATKCFSFKLSSNLQALQNNFKQQEDFIRHYLIHAQKAVINIEFELSCNSFCVGTNFTENIDVINDV